MLNVLTNAAEAALAGGEERWVVMTARDHGEALQITVEDSGTGFGELDPVLAFRPFLSSKPGGSGIGLTITRQIVLAHGGEVAAARAPGGGACFTITI